MRTAADEGELQPDLDVVSGTEHLGAGPAPGRRIRTPSGKSRALPSWPLLVLAVPATVAVRSGWVGIGQLTGFGEVHPLPGIWDSLHLDTAVTLPVGVEACAAYALRAWLSGSDLDALRPAVVHVAAHVEFGLVHLSAGDAKVCAVTTSDLSTAIRSALLPPDLVVLSGCDTGSACDELTRGSQPRGSPVPAAAGWRGNLSDPQALLFTKRFYAKLAAGSTVGQAFDGPLITVTTRWPGQAEPYLRGNALTVPFPPD